MPTWNVERSAHGDAYWLVRVGTTTIAVIVPPGARLSKRDQRREAREGAAGWREALWRTRAAGCRPVIDRDPPDRVRRLDTASVLEKLPEHLHELVWETMLAQYASAREFGQAPLGQVRFEETARVGAFATQWIESELRAAFPERACEVLERTTAAAPPPIPDTPDELLELARRDEPAPAPALPRARARVRAPRLILMMLANYDVVDSDRDPGDPLAATIDSVDLL